MKIDIPKELHPEPARHPRMAELSPLQRTVEGAIPDLRRRTYRAILELTARHPLLNPDDVAVLTGASSTWVRKVMKSDAFTAQRAELVQRLHGPRLMEIQAKMEETASLLLDAIARRIANPDAVVAEATLLKAAELLLDRVFPQKSAAQLPGGAAPSQNVTMVFNGVTAEDIARARAAAFNHGRTIELEHQPQVELIPHVDEDGLPTAPRVRGIEGID
jgi:hypothetical protein